MQISTIGLDIAKNVFQVHGEDSAGRVVLRKRLRRAQVLEFFATLPQRCVIGLEACASAHYWARELAQLNYVVRLVPPAYVKAYVKRGKNDAIDAEAICEAVRRPNMRFVAVKSIENQAVLVLHRVRAQLIRQRTKLSNMLRAHMAEFGLVAAKGKLSELVTIIADQTDERLVRLARIALQEVVTELKTLQRRIDTFEKQIMACHKNDPVSRRLASIPGIGPITATALAASVPDANCYASGRHFAAWMGLTPKDHSTGGKQRLGRISKMGNRHLRSLLVVGATSVLNRAKKGNEPIHEWMRKLLLRRSPRVVTVAYANKMARIAWAVMARGGVYHPEMVITSR